MFVAARRLAAGLAALALAWPATVGAANTTVSAQVCPHSFAQTNLATGERNPTTSTSAAVTGSAEPGYPVALTVNGNVAATVVAATDGTYAAAVPLVLGNNTIVATASDGAFCGDSSTSPPIMLRRNQALPTAPQISQPVNGSITASAGTLVTGSSEPGATVEVLVRGTVSATGTVGGDGVFALTVPLVLGGNLIHARATNTAGTGPLSSPVTVTRQPAATPAGPVIGQPVTTPLVITSPSDGTITSAASVTVTLHGPAGAGVTITVGGQAVATLKLATDGTGQAAVPLQPGDNIIAAASGSATSRSVAVHRSPGLPTAPQITTPADGAMFKTGTITVAGRADPGSSVVVYVGQHQSAKLLTDDAGAFSARVTLSPGLNSLYVTTAAADGTVVRSQIVQVSYQAPTARATPLRGLTVLVTVPVAAVALTGQAFGHALNIVASSPPLTFAVLGIALAATTAGNGLLGLEFLFILPGLLRLLRRRGQGNVLRGRVLDTVTGRPLPFAQVTVGARQPVSALTDRAGSFVLPVGHEIDSALTARRPGFDMVTTNHDHAGSPHLEIGLEPSAASLGPLQSILDVVSGTVAWCSIIFAFTLGWYLLFSHPSVVTFLDAAFATGLLVLDASILVSQPRYHWGRLTDLGGVPISGAVLRLVELGSSHAVSKYPTGKSGRYTLFAEPGQYRLIVTVEGKTMHEEAVTIRRRGVYLGFRLKIPRA